MIWCEYVFHKQTVRGLKGRYFKDKRVIKKLLDDYILTTKIHSPRKVNLVVDGTYFGNRKNHKAWCVVVSCDPKRKENLWWKFVDRETTSVYLEGNMYLEKLGYVIESVTADGFGGVSTAFKGISRQMCHAYMEGIVTARTTQNPILEVGKTLLALVQHYIKVIKKHLKEDCFSTRSCIQSF